MKTTFHYLFLIKFFPQARVTNDLKNITASIQKPATWHLAYPVLRLVKFHTHAPDRVFLTVQDSKGSYRNRGTAKRGQS